MASAVRSRLPMRSVLVATLFVLFSVPLRGQVAGSWSGAVTAGNMSVPVSITIADDSNATLDAPALGFADKELKVVSRDPDRLQFEVVMGEVNVTATATMRGDAMSGSVHAGADVFALALHRATRSPKPYAREQTTIRNGEATLATTLYLPRTAGTMPAVVFVAGLAPRGDAVHFLADQFARRGIAVLTYDRRGLGSSTGDARAGFAAHASDAAAAVRFLHTRKEIDRARIGIRGQSQGAWLAPLAATEVPVAFVIATGGGGVQPWQSESYAIPARMRSDGYSDSEIAEASLYMAKLFEAGRTGEGWDELNAMMSGLRERKARWFGKYGSVPASFERLRRTWQNEFSYDPLSALQKLEAPLLALAGEKDVYSPPAESLRVIAAHAGSKDKTVRLIAGATHDFHLTQTPLPVISSEYLETMLQWTEAHVRPSATAANRSVSGNRIASRDPKLTIDVDASLQYAGSIEFNIRDAAHAERVIFVSADAAGNVQRMFIAQFESMLPNYRGSYDAPAAPRVRLGPLEFHQAAGRYSFAESIKAKPGAEAERTRDFLAGKGMRVDAPLVVARFDTSTGRERRDEVILFYWEAGASLEGFVERAKTMFRVVE